MWQFLAIILFSALILVIMMGVPIGFGVGLLSAVGFYFLVGPEALNTIASQCWEHGTSWSLTCLPLFVLMAEVIVFTGMGSATFKLARVWLNRIPGGVAIGTVLACAIFAAACGTSTACAIAIGMMSIPEMMKQGYDKKLAVGSTAVGGTLGVLIPPSIVMIIYGTLTEQSIGHLFIAGLLPGLLIVFLICAYIIIIAKLKPNLVAQVEHYSWKERLESLKEIIGMVCLIVLIFYALYGGLCTPTEVAAIGAFGSLVMAVIYRKLNWHNLRDALMRTVQLTSFVIFIMIGAVSFSTLVAYLGITRQMTDAFLALNLPPLALLLFIYFIYIILGCFLDATGMMVLTLPFVFPIIIQLGYDPIWFGIVITILCEMGYITPPFGFNLFVIKSISPPDVSFGNIMSGSFPFVIILLIGIAILTIFPEIVLWLPSTMSAFR